ncbi:MAG TPA: PAS domain S-box protein, partial [Phototrophicaceae bacterium]|nr:PAS domain S-box protein [Phototrophicaceae bacterium]
MTPAESLLEELQSARTRISELEHQLDEVRHEFDQMVQYMPLATAMFDTDMRYLRVNPGWMQGYGLNEIDPIGKSHYEVFPEIGEDWKAIHRRCLAGEINLAEREPFPRADGKLDWLRWLVRPWYTASGETGGLLMYTSVITSQIEAEEKLRSSEARYRSIVEDNPDFIMIISRDYQIEFVNWFSIGLTPEQVIGHDVFEFVPPAFTEIARSAYQAVLSGQPTAEYETLGPGPNPDANWYETRVHPIYEHGKITGLTLIATNITERKRIQDALYDSESNAQSLLRLSRRLENAATDKEVIDAVAREIDERIGYHSIWFYLFPPEGKYAELIGGAGEAFDQVMSKATRIKIEGDALLEEIATASHIVEVIDARIDPRTANKPLVAAMDNRTIVNIPINLPDQRLGVLGTGSFGDEGVRVLMQPQMDYLAALASHVAVVMDRIRFQDARYQAEAALRKSEANLKEAQRIASVGSFEINPQSGEIIWSDETYRIYEVEPGTPMTIERYGSLVTRMDFEQFQSRVERTVETHQPYEVEYDVQLHDGTIKSIYVMSRPTTDDQGNIRIFGAVQDITARKQVERALRRREADLKEAQRIAKIGNFEFDPETDEIIWSDETYRIYGIEVGSPMTLERYRNLIPSKVFEQVQEKITRALATSEPYELEYDITLDDGTRKVVNVISRPMTDASGKTKIFGIVQDITAHREAETALRHSETNLKEAQRIAHIGNFEVDPASGNIIWSDETYRIFEVEPGTPISIGFYQRFLKLKNPDDVQTRVSRAIETRQPYEVEYDVGLPDGTQKSIFVVSRPIVDETTNEVTKIFGIVQDVTARKQAEEALRRSESNLKEAQRIAKIGNFEVDPASGELIWSDETYRIYGIEIGTPMTVERYRSLVTPQNFEKVQERIARAAATNEPYEIEYDVVLHDGTRKVMNVISRPMTDASGKTKIFGIAQDVTARKMVEEALRRSEINLKQAQRIAKIGNFEYDPASGSLVWSDESYRIYEIETGTPITIDLYRKLLPADKIKELQSKIADA